MFILLLYNISINKFNKKEAGIALISTFLTASVANAIRRRLTSKAAKVIRNTCVIIYN
jgi:hypothetical protein